MSEAPFPAPPAPFNFAKLPEGKAIVVLEAAGPQTLCITHEPQTFHPGVPTPVDAASVPVMTNMRDKVTKRPLFRELHAPARKKEVPGG